MSSTSPAPMPRVAFKVELRRKDRDPTFHRFTGSYTYAELVSVITHLWGDRPKHLVIDYQDDEGDQVRLCSQGEWEECLRIFAASGANLLRLTGKRSKDEKKRRHRDSAADTSAEIASDSENEEMPTVEAVKSEPSASKRSTRSSTKNRADTPQDAAARLLDFALRSLPGSAINRTQPVEVPAPVAEEAQVPAPELPEPSASRRQAPSIECDANKAVVDLMSIMYNCDASVELFRGATEKFGSVVKRIVNPFVPEEVHLDIDRLKLYRDVVSKGNVMIDEKKYMEAERLLRTSLIVFQDSVILEYNLACVQSLQGFPEEAIELLLAARSHGYDDIEHLKNDPDLENARKHPRFVEIVPAPEPEPVVPEVSAPVVEEPVAPAPEPVPEPVPAPQPTSSQRRAPAPAVESDPQAMTLLSIFPEMTMAEAVDALKRSKGNLSRAVNARLSGQ